MNGKNEENDPKLHNKTIIKIFFLFIKLFYTQHTEKKLGRNSLYNNNNNTSIPSSFCHT